MEQIYFVLYFTFNKREFCYIEGEKKYKKFGCAFRRLCL